MYNNNFNSVFNDFYDAFNSVSSTRVPAVDVTESKESYCIEAELPGYKKEDVDIKLENHNLTIMSSKTYNKELEDEKDEGDYLVKETKLKQTFKRTFGLPKDVDEEKIDAKFKDGVLTITVPKSQKVQPTTIQIEAK
jgi:HSP20 family molecular chaperone IbpA